MKLKTLEFRVEARRTNGHIAIRATHPSGAQHEFYLVSVAPGQQNLSILSQEIIRALRTGDAEKRIQLTDTFNSITQLYLRPIMETVPNDTPAYMEMPSPLD
jgi:hypothetical protein